MLNDGSVCVCVCERERQGEAQKHLLCCTRAHTTGGGETTELKSPLIPFKRTGIFSRISGSNLFLQLSVISSISNSRVKKVKSIHRAS